jgi:hypothetical protein
MKRENLYDEEGDSSWWRKKIFLIERENLHDRERERIFMAKRENLCDG